MTIQIERRYVPTEFDFRVEKRDGADRLLIEGYAYKFHARSQNLGGFVEQILPGAGEESAREDDIRALFNHDANLILGRSRPDRESTLTLGEDSEGLPYSINADMRQSYVRDLAIAFEREDVTQSSFGFTTPPGGTDWGFTEDETPLRSVLKMRLFDVSPVTFPAYTSSTSGIGRRAIEALYESRGIDLSTPIEEAIRAMNSPLPTYDLNASEDAMRAQRFILLNRK